MRLLSFLDGTRPAVGCLSPYNRVIRLDDLLPEFSSLDMIGVLAVGIPLRQRVTGALAQVPQNMPSRRFDDVTLLPPVQCPSKIIGAARNYFDAIEKLNIEVPVRPQLFAKLPNTVIAHGAPIPLWAASKAVIYEGELAVIIGTRGRDIPAAQAMDFVGGYTVLNDVSATDVTRQDSFILVKISMESAPLARCWSRKMTFQIHIIFGFPRRSTVGSSRIPARHRWFSAFPRWSR